MANALAAEAFAKVNLSLVLGARAADGYHPLLSLAQSVSWADRLQLRFSDDDEFIAEGMEAEDDNLAWRAVQSIRSEAESSRPVALMLEKRIAISAGLGGGSADAACALALAAELHGLPDDRLTDVARELGADVPFCLSGGFALLEGRGEQITQQPAVDGYALGIVVPFIELSSPAVYERWDEVGEPEGEAFAAADLPPGLRDYQPLRNDLAPAAQAMEPELGDLRSQLAGRWGRAVGMSGSGPALFGFFLDEEEAREAVSDPPSWSRAARAVLPVPRGWRKAVGTLAGPE